MPVNKFLVGGSSTQVHILRNVNRPLTIEEALNLAVWIVAVCDLDRQRFNQMFEAETGIDTPDRLTLSPGPALTFELFQQLNETRCTKLFHPGSDRSAWWPIELWALAIAGEAGELANVCKKLVRGDFPMNQARPLILAELADVVTYCDLAFTRLGASTAVELVRKFNEVSRRRNYPEVEL